MEIKGWLSRLEVGDQAVLLQMWIHVSLLFWRPNLWIFATAKHVNFFLFFTEQNLFLLQPTTYSHKNFFFSCVEAEIYGEAREE
jgi:hypothetical protein